MLRRHGTALGYPSGFTILDREDDKDLINTGGGKFGIDPKEIRFPKADVLADIFSFVVNTERPMEEILAEQFAYFRRCSNRSRMCTRVTSERRKRLTRWISTICW